MAELKAVIFDMDGTLVDTEKYHYSAVAKVLKDYGIRYTYEDHLNKFTGSGSELLFKTVFKENNLDNNVDEAVHKKTEYFGEMIEEGGVDLLVGLDDFLIDLKENGIRLMVASGSRKEIILEVLEKTRILDFFEIIVSGREVENPKPAPDIFLRVMELANLKAENCVVFEDAINGVKSAKSAGLFCIGIDSAGNSDLLEKAGTGMIIRDYKNLNTKKLLFIYENQKR